MVNSGIGAVRAWLQEISTPLPSPYRDPSEAPISLIYEGGKPFESSAKHSITALPGILHFLSWRRFSLLCDLLSLFLLCSMLLRTCMYITRRKSGSVGPLMAPVLLKFWSIFGAAHFFSQALTLYLAPFQGEILISCVRAPVLLLLCYGRQLPITNIMYHKYLVPVYESNEPEIEGQLRKAKTLQAEVSEGFRQLATYLLQQIAVGGLEGLVPIPRYEGIQSSSEPRAPSASKRNEHEGSPLPQNTAVFASSRQFFGGESDHRARSVLAVDGQNLDGAIQPAKLAETPKAAYDDARALRRQFRNRPPKNKQNKVAT